MADQGKQQSQQGGQRNQQRGGGQKPGEKQTNKSGQAGKRQEELDKKWRDMAEPGQEPGTGSPGK